MLLNCSPEAILARQAEIDLLTNAQRNLMLGKAVRVLVDQNGERIEYTQASVKMLADELMRLRQEQLLCSQQVCGVRQSITRPMNFVF